MKVAIKKLLLACVAALFALVLAESVVRLLGISFPLPYAPDPNAGWRLEPGFASWFGKEGGAYVQFNRQGFRDREHSLDKPPGTFRVAVLGDSFAEAAQVSAEKTFWSVLERELEACSALEGRAVEVLNFGVSGYGTAQQLQILRHEVWKYEPDLVLLAFFSGNDLRNNSRDLEPQKNRPFFELTPQGLDLDDSFRNHPDYLKANEKTTRWKVWLINHSRLLQLLNEVKTRWSGPRQPAVAGGNAEAGIDELCFAEPHGEALQEAWRITEAILRTMAKECRERRAEFWVATVPAGIQVHPDPHVRAELQTRLGTNDLLYPERRVRQVGDSGEFPVVELGSLMLRVAESNGTYFHGFANTKLGEGHWNESGHRFAGEQIASAICSSPSARNNEEEDGKNMGRKNMEE